MGVGSAKIARRPLPATPGVGTSSAYTKSIATTYQEHTHIASPLHHVQCVLYAHACARPPSVVCLPCRSAFVTICYKIMLAMAVALTHNVSVSEATVPSDIPTKEQYHDQATVQPRRVPVPAQEGPHRPQGQAEH